MRKILAIPCVSKRIVEGNVPPSSPSGGRKRPRRLLAWGDRRTRRIIAGILAAIVLLAIYFAFFYDTTPSLPLRAGTAFRLSKTFVAPLPLCPFDPSQGNETGYAPAAAYSWTAYQFRVSGTWMRIQGAWSSNYRVFAFLASDPLNPEYFRNMACPLLPVKVTTAASPYLESVVRQDNMTGGAYTFTARFYVVFFSMYPADVAVIQDIVAESGGHGYLD